MGSRFALLSALLPGVFLASGCRPAPADGVTESSADSPTASLSAHDAHVHDAAVADQSARLEAMFGQFVSGRAAVYRGTFEAKDNASILGGGRHDGVFPRSSAMASLVPDREGLGGVTLGVVGTPSGQHVELFQNGTTTTISLVDAPDTIGGLFSSCDRCFVDLTQHPASLGFADVVARGQYGDVPSSPSEVTVSGSFLLVPPDVIAFDDICDLELLDIEFVPAGSDMVATASATLEEPLPSAGPNASPCFLATDYAIDLWVSRANIAANGLRSFRTLGSRTCCGAGVGEGGALCESVVHDVPVEFRARAE